MVSQVVKKFPAFSGKLWFLAVFTAAQWFFLL
jgi:hypothetical protein